MKKNPQSTNDAIIAKLVPQPLWEHFNTLCMVPRASRNEKEIAQVIINLAINNGYESVHDDLNNVVVYVPATPGYEDYPSLCLQSHLYMMDEKDNGVESVFPIELSLSDDKLTAIGTTLGAIGVASMMALITEKNIPHGPLELLFTTVEETGLIGAAGFDYSFIKSKMIINLDSEEEGVVMVGCAGGSRIKGIFHPEMFPRPEEHRKYTITISNFTGGHSGLDINKGRANAIKVMSLVLLQVHSKDMRIITFSGGSKMNAIPRTTQASIIIPRTDIATFPQKFQEAFHYIMKSYPDENAHCEIKEISRNSDERTLSKDATERFLYLMLDLPNGVMAMEYENPMLVRTSNNIGIVEMQNGMTTITSLPRSSNILDMEIMKQKIQSIFMEHGATITILDSSYPPWEPKFDSPLLQRFINAYKQIYIDVPVVETIHAGLECAIIKQNLPDADIISVGPTMGMVHTTDEWVDVNSVARFWKLLNLVLITKMRGF